VFYLRFYPYLPLNLPFNFDLLIILSFDGFQVSTNGRAKLPTNYKTFFQPSRSDSLLPFVDETESSSGVPATALTHRGLGFGTNANEPTQFSNQSKLSRRNIFSFNKDPD